MPVFHLAFLYQPGNNFHQVDPQNIGVSLSIGHRQSPDFQIVVGWPGTNKNMRHRKQPALERDKTEWIAAVHLRVIPVPGFNIQKLGISLLGEYGSGNHDAHGHSK